MVIIKAYEFIKQTINSSKIDDTFTRKDIVNKLLQYYKPNIYSKSNATIRSIPDMIFKALSKKGIIARSERGVYKVLKHIKDSYTIEDLKAEYFSTKKKKNEQ